MSETPSNPHFLRDALTCPRCRSEVLEAVSDGTQNNLLCHTCWTCWHVELGYMAPVPVPTCPGCPYENECLRRRSVEITAGEGGGTNPSP
jgi:hypothetical protein